METDETEGMYDLGTVVSRCVILGEIGVRDICGVYLGPIHDQ